MSGPNELSVTDKDMLPYILGPQGMPRGPREIHKCYHAASDSSLIRISIRGEANYPNQRQGYGTL